jgi:pimeloyl-ACP methyl ester carboxylesterase
MHPEAVADLGVVRFEGVAGQPFETTLGRAEDAHAKHYTSAPMPARLVSIGPRHVSLSDDGAGAPVLLLHSGGFSSRQWRRLAQALAPSYRVLVPDLLGYGASSPIGAGEPFDYREDVDAVAAIAGGEAPLHVVGHSYGGLLALQLALKNPGAVRSLALYEPVAFGALDQAGDEPLRDATGLIASEFEGEPWLARFVEWWNGPGAWAGLAADARASFVAVGWKLFREVNSLLADRTSSATYGTIAAPTLLLGGGKTPPAERRVVENLAAAMPRAKLEIFPEMGHMGPITHAATVNAVIASHLAAN